jgi:hypothetical protein
MSMGMPLKSRPVAEASSHIGTTSTIASGSEGRLKKMVAAFGETVLVVTSNPVTGDVCSTPGVFRKMTFTCRTTASVLVLLNMSRLSSRLEPRMQGDMAALVGKNVELPPGCPCWREDCADYQ